MLASIVIYITTYAQIRGEIDATRKDIKILTTKVESIKFEYLKKIADYKNELDAQYELEKTLINSKTEAYKLATSIKIIILKRENDIGNEKKLNKQLFEKIPQLLIMLNSQIQLRNDFKEEISELVNNYNEIVLYIQELRKSQAKTYSIEFDEIKSALDKIQTKLLGK